MGCLESAVRNAFYLVDKGTANSKVLRIVPPSPLAPDLHEFQDLLGLARLLLTRAFASGSACPESEAASTAGQALR